MDMLYLLYRLDRYPTTFSICQFYFFPLLHTVIDNAHLGALMQKKQRGASLRRCTTDIGGTTDHNGMAAMRAFVIALEGKYGA